MKYILMKLSNILSRRNRILLRELVVTDFKLRYQGSALGYVWSLLKPLFLFAILYLVFDHFLRLGRDVEHFPVYLLLGIVLWTFFTETTINALQAIISRGDLIRKINFPKYIIVVSGTISALINLGLNLIVVFIFMLFNGVHIDAQAFFVIPLVIELYLFALALGFFLSALNVKFRDTGYLWEIVLQAAFYATPIIYPLTMVMSQNMEIAKFIMLNPVAQIIQDMRYVLITHDTFTISQIFHNTWYYIAIPFFIVIIVVIFGGLFFRKNSKMFAESV